MFLFFNLASASTFYINNTENGAWDYVYNDTDEYGIYLDYLNPYGVECEDLRECFIDDTNSPSGFDEQPHWDFLIDNFFEGDTNIVPVWENASFKESSFPIDSQLTYALTAYFNDTSNSDYYAIIQRGTVWDKYKLDLVNWTTLQGDILTTVNCPTANNKCNAVAETSWYQAFAYRGSTYVSDHEYNFTVWYLNGTDDEIAFFVYTIYDNSTGTFELVGSGSYITSHYQKNNHAIDSSFWDIGSSGSQGYAYTSATDFSTLSIVGTSNWNSFLDNNNYWFKGDAITLFPAGWTGFFIMPKLQIGIDGGYRSVGLPTCEDIYIGNEQTNFEWDSPYWVRECSGTVPAVNTTELTCSLECLQEETIYQLHSKTATADFIPSSSTQYTTHISMFPRGDGYGYIFPTGTPTSQIGDVRIYSYVQFESDNATQIFALNGWGLMNTVPDSFTPQYQPHALYPPYGSSSCSTGIQNVTAYHIWGHTDGILDNEIAQSYTSLSEYSTDFLGINAYYNAYFEISKTNSDCTVYFNQPVDVSGNKELIIYAEWENVTESLGTECVEYESICYPTPPEGEYYDNDTVICVGLSCYAVSESFCNNDGTCNIDVETSVNCPADCPTATIPETVETISDTIEDGFGYLGTILGTDSIGAKALIWTIISLIVGALLGGYIAVKGSSGAGAGLLSVITIFGMMLVGTIIGMLPLWFGLIFLVIAGILIASVVKGAFGGDL